MGFKNKKKSNFVPIDLNEDNVKTIFERCLAAGDKKFKDTERCNLIYESCTVSKKILS